jgi:hypothetical protein
MATRRTPGWSGRYRAHVDEPVTDEELERLALAADPDVELDPAAIPIHIDGASELLPSWYMPAAVGHAVPGWRRRVALVVVGAILLINAAGLCVTYGSVTVG